MTRDRVGWASEAQITNEAVLSKVSYALLTHPTRSIAGVPDSLLGPAHLRLVRSDGFRQSGHARGSGPAVHRLQSRVLGQPGLYLLALVHPQVVQNDPDRLDQRGDLRVDIFQKRDKFRLSLPASGSPVDLAAPRIESREQIQCSAPAVFVFDPVG